MQKISLFQLLILEIHSVLESSNQIDHTHFWSYPPIKLSIQIFFFLNWYQHAKNQAISLISFIQKYCNLIVRKHFGPNLRKKIFTKHRLCTETKKIIFFFNIEQIQQKLRINFFNKFKMALVLVQF